MSWWTTVLGGAFGFILGGPLGALLGAALREIFQKIKLILAGFLKTII